MTLCQKKRKLLSQDTNKKSKARVEKFEAGAGVQESSLPKPNPLPTGLRVRLTKGLSVKRDICSVKAKKGTTGTADGTLVLVDGEWFDRIRLDAQHLFGRMVEPVAPFATTPVIADSYSAYVNVKRANLQITKNILNECLIWKGYERYVQYLKRETQTMFQTMFAE